MSDPNEPGSTPRRNTRLRVSRHGLTRCLECGRHIRYGASVAETACPFCGASLGASLAKASPLTTIGRGARGGLLAAGLLGALACESEPIAQPVYGAPADVTESDAVDEDVSGSDVPVITDDIGAEPMYGVPPPDVANPDDVAPPEDISVQPLYGGPPADVTDPPEDVPEEPDDVPVQPLYGGPPTDDITEPEDTSHPVEDSGPTPVPLYGLPPSDAS